jgi:hypothetical protein
MSSASFSILRSIPLMFLLASAGQARACTICDSAAGRSLRAGIFDGHFLRNLAVVASPFPIFALAVAGLPFALGRLTPPRSASSQEET